METTQKAGSLDGALSWLSVPNSRSELRLDSLLVATSGVMIPLGLARLFAGGPLGLGRPVDIPGSLPLFLAGLITLGVAATVLFVKSLSSLRPFGISAAVMVAVLFAEAFSRVGDTPKGGLGMFFFALISAGLFVLPKTRHVVFLGAVLFTGWRFLLLLSADGDTPTTFATGMNPTLNPGFTNVGAVISIFLAGLCLAAVFVFDSQNTPGLALPFAAVGILIAAVAVRGNINFVVSVLALLLAGAAVWVGSRSERRGVAWAGAAGIVLALGRLYDGFDHRISGFFLLLLGLGVLGFAARDTVSVLGSRLGNAGRNKAVVPPGAVPGQPGVVGQNPNQAQPFGAPSPAFPSQPVAGQGQPVEGQNPTGYVQSASGQQPDKAPDGVSEVDNYQLAEAQTEVHGEPDLDSTVQQPAIEDPAFGNNAQPGAPHVAGSFDETNSDTAPSSDDLTAGHETAAIGEPEGGDTQHAEPNWYADPTERYDHRWHDGVNWTEHVATAGNSAVDPLH